MKITSNVFELGLWNFIFCSSVGSILCFRVQKHEHNPKTLSFLAWLRKWQSGIPSNQPHKLWLTLWVKMSKKLQSNLWISVESCEVCLAASFYPLLHMLDSQVEENQQIVAQRMHEVNWLNALRLNTEHAATSGPRRMSWRLEIHIKDRGAFSMCLLQPPQEQEIVGSLLFRVCLKLFSGVWNDFAFPK